MKTLLTTITAALLIFANAAQAAPDAVTEKVFNNLLTAVIKADVEAFAVESDAAMKAAITNKIIETVSAQIAPRAKEGYKAEYLGMLNQQGFEVHLWRLVFKDGKDDILATLSMKDGKAGGFFLK